MKNRYNWYKAFKRAKHYGCFRLQRVFDIAKFIIDFYNIDTSNSKNIRIKETLKWLVWASIFYKFYHFDVNTAKKEIIYEKDN